MEDNFSVFIAGVAFCSLGCILALFVLVFNVKFFNLRFIKMTSPRINILLVIGALALYTSSLLVVLPINTWNTDSQKALVQCRLWLLALGFTVTFGSMLVKGWRVHKLFQYPRTHTVTIKDRSLFGGIVVLIFLDLGLLISWQIIDPVTCMPRDSIGEDSILGEKSACASNFHSIWMIVLLSYKYATIFMCCYVGWQIRHINFAALDDSRCLLLSSGITLTLASIVSVVMLLYPTDSLTLLAVSSFSMWIGTTSVLLINFLPKMLVLCKAGGLEPLMGSVSKYIQQPISGDVGTELIKILGENQYLRRKLEERDLLVRHLKKKISSSLGTDSESQQTSSANYSDNSSNTIPGPQSKPKSFCFTFSCLSVCCDSRDQSIKAEQGSPTEERDMSIESVKTIDILTMPVVQEQCCHSYLPQPRIEKSDSKNYHVSASVLPTITISHATPKDCISVVNAQHHIVADAVDVGSAENVTVIQPVSDIAHSDDLYINDIDLLCSIADTYNLGGDSDTLSYISSCLHNTKSWSLKRKSHHHSQSAMLGSDQLYPESMLSVKQSRTKSKGQRRRQSVAASSNLYMNEKGKPLII